MSILSLVPALLGFLIVAQAGLNRKVAGAWGLPVATLLNGLVLTTIATLAFFYFQGRSAPEGSLFRVQLDGGRFAWWFLLPGTIGFLLVVLGPWAISRWGAVHTFVLLISAQLLGSLLWDLAVEGIEISRMRVLGIVLAWAGAWMSTLRG